MEAFVRLLKAQSSFRALPREPAQDYDQDSSEDDLSFCSAEAQARKMQILALKNLLVSVTDTDVDNFLSSHGGFALEPDDFAQTVLFFGVSMCTLCWQLPFVRTIEILTLEALFPLL